MRKSRLQQGWATAISVSVMMILASACGGEGVNPLEVERYDDGGTSYTLITNAYGALGAERASQIILVEDSTKEALWTYEAAEMGGLNFAHNAEILDDEILISDTQHNRVIIARAMNGIYTDDPGFEAIWRSEDIGNFELDYPNDANFLSGGNLLITDRNHHRVIEVNRATGEIVWQFGVTGEPGIDDSHLDGPHNADRLSNGDTVVADSNNDRILVIDAGGAIAWRYHPGGSDRLKWPRDSDVLDDGNVLIADSLSGRVIEVSPAGEILWKYRIGVIATQTAPYDVDLLDNGNVLFSSPGITSSGSVFEVDYVTREVLWSYP